MNETASKQILNFGKQKPNFYKQKPKQMETEPKQKITKPKYNFFLKMKQKISKQDDKQIKILRKSAFFLHVNDESFLTHNKVTLDN